MKYIANKKNNRKIIKTIRDWGFLNKFLNGVRITRINPTKLLIKNRGYRRIFVQKSFIINFFNLKRLYRNHYIYNSIKR